MSHPTVELEEVTGFLAQHEPFSRLPHLAALTSELSVLYARRGTQLLRAGERGDNLYIIRSGAVDVISEEGQLVDRRGAGESLAYSTLVEDPVSRYTFDVVEDCLLLVLPRAAFQAVSAENPDLARFYDTEARRASHLAHELQEDSTELLRTRLSEMTLRPVQSVSPDATIAEAARAMTQAGTSSLLVLDDGQLRGIVTDRDLRTRVLAANLDPSEPVRRIMTANPLSVRPDAMAMEVHLLMTERGFHHMPVVGDRVLGVVTDSEIARLLHADPIFVAADLSRRSSLAELRGAFTEAATLAVRYIDRGSSPQEVANIITMAADALARRLCQLAELELGPPPVPYAFVAVGSQGRREMGLASDQDNALVLDNSYDAEAHGEYFARLAEFVCRGLDAGGQSLCPGEMMAKNPRWRMTVAQWEQTFATWTAAPEPDALLHAQVFFDFRAIAGTLALGERVHASAVAAATSQRLHAHLASLAARREPPLTFFRGLVVERDGQHVNTLDIKKGGTAGIVQMARLFALAAGSTSLETDDRLTSAAGKSVSAAGAHELADAHSVLRALTLRHQSLQVRAGQTPNYRIYPAQLSRLEREQLRDAFRIIKSMQNALATKYPVRNI